MPTAGAEATVVDLLAVAFRVVKIIRDSFEKQFLDYD